MQISYDKKADTKYVRFKKGKVVKTKKQQEWLLFDCAKNGDVLGAEIINASKNLISFTTLDTKLVGYSLVTPAINHSSRIGDESKEESLDIKSPKYNKSLLFAAA